MSAILNTVHKTIPKTMPTVEQIADLVLKKLFASKEWLTMQEDIKDLQEDLQEIEKIFASLEGQNYLKK